MFQEVLTKKKQQIMRIKKVNKLIFDFKKFLIYIIECVARILFVSMLSDYAIKSKF